jgi:hypothetical protein
MFYVANLAMTGLESVSAYNIVSYLPQLLKLCGALHNSACFPKAMPLDVFSSFPKALPLG